MRKIVVALAILPLAFLIGACSKQGERRIVAPEPESPAQGLVADAAWVADRDEVARAASIAAAHPLVGSVLAEHAGDRLAYRPEFALRGQGRMVSGRNVSVTILPYVTGGDETHATFVSLLESGDDAGVSHAEVIWGRDPRPDETGYEAFLFGGVRGWIREDDLRVVTLGRVGSLSPERFNLQKFLTCFNESAGAMCAAGSSLATQIAPGMPSAGAVGCAAGTAAAAIGCAIVAFAK